MNNLKSYTEYAVTTPTTDFVIGFDFNYGTDAVNITVDDVPATEAGYTVIYLNSTTMRLSPAVPSGVVRLQRETDIDDPDNQFIAGAKFNASNMDENFTQVRKSQQEVRDGFEKLSEDTYEIIDTLQVVGQAAQDAADAAEQAAQTANDAAAQVNDKVAKSATLPTYLTVADGVNPVTGVSDGAYFNVSSEDDDTIAIEYQNVGGSAVATGKSYLSALGVQQQEKPASTIKDASGKTQQELTNFKPNLLNQTGATPSSDVTMDLQVFARSADDNSKPTIEIPMNGFDYNLSAPIIIQEPTSIVGDKGATYDRGLGKKGWFLLGSGATHGFDLGNYRTYQAGLYDPDNNISPNPADYWTVKNIGIKPADGVTPRTQDGIRLTTQTNGPDRALQIDEVSLKRLDKAIYIAEMQGDSIVTVASLNVSNSAINLCNHGVFVEGRCFQACIEGNQIEQNYIASVWGAFDGATRIINNVIEGAQPHGIVFVIPDDEFGSQNQAIIESHYFESLTENCIQINAVNGSAYWLRGNKNYNTLTKDYCLIKKGSRTNIYNEELERITLEDGVTLNLNSKLTNNTNYSFYMRPTVAAFSASSCVHKLGQLKSPDASYTRFIPSFTRKITKVYDQLAYAAEVNQSMPANITTQAGDLLEISVLVKCSSAGSANTIMNLTNAGGQIVGSFQLRLIAGEYAVGTVLTRALIATSGTSYMNVPSSDAIDLEIFGVALKNHGPVTIGNRYLISPCQPALHTIAGKHAQRYEYAGVTVPANGVRKFDLSLSAFGSVGDSVQAALSVYVADLEISAIVRAGGVVQVTLRNPTAADIIVPACQVRVIVL